MGVVTGLHPFLLPKQLNYMELSPYSIPGIHIEIPVFIEQQIEKIFGLSLGQIMIKCREKRLVVPRQAYVAAMCRYNKCTQEGISVLLWEKYRLHYDHATVHHAEETIEQVYLPGKVSNVTDIIYAQKVQQFYKNIQDEWMRQQSLKHENNSTVRAHQRVRITEIVMLLAKDKLPRPNIL